MECYIIHTIKYDKYFPTEAITSYDTFKDAYKHACSQIDCNQKCRTHFDERHKRGYEKTNILTIQFDDETPDCYTATTEDERDFGRYEVKHLPIDIESVQHSDIQKLGLSAISMADPDANYQPHYAPYDVVIKKIEEGLKTILLWTIRGANSRHSTACFLEVRRALAIDFGLRIAIITDESSIFKEYTQKVCESIVSSKIFSEKTFSLKYRIKSAQDLGYKFILVLKSPGGIIGWNTDKSSFTQIVTSDKQNTQNVVIYTNNLEEIGAMSLNDAIKCFNETDHK